MRVISRSRSHSFNDPIQSALDAGIPVIAYEAGAVPESSIAEVAEYDAAAALIKLLAWDRAADVLEAFRRDYPDSEYAAEVSQRLAVSYMNAGRGVEAAQEFERISLADTSSEGVRREALWKAADLYNDAGESSAEQRVLENTITRY